MALIICIDFLAVAILLGIVLTRGIESSLPYVTFVCILIPGVSRINIGFDLTTQRLVLVVLLVCFFAFGKSNPAMKKTPLGWLILAQVIWALLSTATSVDPVMSLKKLLSVVAEYYLLYYIFLKSITSVRTVYKILGAMVAAMVVCSVFGVFEAYAGWHVLSLFPAKMSVIGEALGLVGGAESRRLTSTFPHAILYGAALAIAITVAMHLAKVANSRNRRIMVWAAILLMFLNIYKSLSRGPWLGLMLGFLLFLLFESAKVRKYQLVIAGLCIMVMVIRPGVLETITNMYKETVVTDNWDNPAGLSYQYRFELRRVAQAALAKNATRFLLGYGMESFAYLGLKGNLAGHEFPFMSCDSAWIETMVETGYVGLILLALLLFKPAVWAWKDFRKFPDPAKYLSLTFFVCMIVYYFMMISVAMYSWGQEGYMLWILISASIAYGKIVRLQLVRPAVETAPIDVPHHLALPV